MAYLVTFLEGVVTFISPCLLPMLPLYLAYFAGGQRGERERISQTLVCALCFVCGFSAVFMSLGVFAGTLGSLLVRYRHALDLVCGTVIILLGLNYLNVIRLSALDRTLRLSTRAVPRSPLSSLMFGVVFALGWSPCVGTFLASALSLAANSASALRGMGLLACFSLGLGVPYVLAALVIDRLSGVFDWVHAHQATVDRVCGAVLVAMGALMASGMLTMMLSSIVGG